MIPPRPPATTYHSASAQDRVPAFPHAQLVAPNFLAGEQFHGQRRGGNSPLAFSNAKPTIDSHKSHVSPAGNAGPDASYRIQPVFYLTGFTSMGLPPKTPGAPADSAA